MGSIYKRKWKDPRTGEVHEWAVWWIKYYRDGIPIRESAETDKESEARMFLGQREGDVARGAPVNPRAGRIRFEELVADLEADYEVNKRRSLLDMKRRLRLHLIPFFKSRRASSITTPDINRYILDRQSHDASNATINRELAALKRAYSVAMRGGKLLSRPYIPMLRENNVRSGFFEREQFESVRRHLPEDLRPVVTFAYVTGWRIRSEVLRLQWRQVDFQASTVRLDPGTTKNDDGRVFPFTVELRATLESQNAKVEALKRQRGVICPWVFHRAGKPIRSFRRSWATALETAGLADRIPHDLRRTAVRNLVRAGIPERVAMQMTGHKTRSVFERYNIVSEGDLREAAARLDRAAGTVSGTVNQLRVVLTNTVSP